MDPNNIQNSSNFRLTTKIPTITNFKTKLVMFVFVFKLITITNIINMYLL